LRPPVPFDIPISRRELQLRVRPLRGRKKDRSLQARSRNGSAPISTWPRTSRSWSPRSLRPAGLRPRGKHIAVLKASGREQYRMMRPHEGIIKQDIPRISRPRRHGRASTWTSWATEPVEVEPSRYDPRLVLTGFLGAGRRPSSTGSSPKSTLKSPSSRTSSASGRRKPARARDRGRLIS